MLIPCSQSDRLPPPEAERCDSRPIETSSISYMVLLSDHSKHFDQARLHPRSQLTSQLEHIGNSRIALSICFLCHLAQRGNLHWTHMLFEVFYVHAVVFTTLCFHVTCTAKLYHSFYLVITHLYPSMSRDSDRRKNAGNGHFEPQT
jgi:hypothetical protein